MYGLTKTQNLADADFIFDENTSLETVLTTADDSKIGFKADVDLKCPDKIKQNQSIYPFCRIQISRFITIHSLHEKYYAI